MPAMSAENPWVASLRGFAEFGDRVAVCSRGRTLTYAELAAQADAVRAAVIEAGARSGRAGRDRGAQRAGRGRGELRRDGERRRRVRGRSQSRPRRRRLCDAASWACAAPSPSATKLHRVAALGLDVLILEDIVARPARDRRVAAVRSARLGQGDHDLRHHRTPEGHHPSPRPPLVRACAAALAPAVRAGRGRPRAADDRVCAWRRAGDRGVARERRLGRADRRRRCRLCRRTVRARRTHRRVRAADRADEAGRRHAAQAHRRHQVHLLRHRDPAARALSRGRRAVRAGDPRHLRQVGDVQSDHRARDRTRPRTTTAISSRSTRSASARPRAASRS